MAAFFTVLLGISALLLGYFLYVFGQENFIRETKDAIDIEIEHILSIIEDKEFQEKSQYIEDRTKYKEHPIYLYYDNEGNIIAGNIDEIPTIVDSIAEGLVSFDVMIDGENRTVAAKIHTFDDGRHLLIARDISKIINSYNTLELFTYLIMFLMLLVIIVSFFISFFVVDTINIIAGTAKDIMDTGDLTRRISIDTNWDDLSNLAQILNRMFERIEVLMHNIKYVSDNIAHDLKTPLTRLRNHLESHVDKGKGASEAEIEKILQEADNMLSTFNAILRISSLEKGKRHQDFTDIDLKELIEDVIELYEPLAEHRSISIVRNLADNYNVKGDRDLLFQLFTNLIDNAIKFSDNGKIIEVTIINNKKQKQIIIADNGIGISDEEISKVFDRFYRCDKSRTIQGNGLGLSLVKAAVEIHNGQIELYSNNPGLKVVVVL